MCWGSMLRGIWNSEPKKFPGSVTPESGYASNPREIPPLPKPTASRERSRKEKASARSGRNDRLLALRHKSREVDKEMKGFAAAMR
jgi:hypothetical protein